MAEQSQENRILASLNRLSASHVSDGLKMSGETRGGTISGLPPIGAKVRMIGRAVTVGCRYRPEGDVEPEAYGAARILAAVGMGQVLVLGNGGAKPAVFGLVAAHAVANQGGAGVIVDGGVRDASAISELALPVFARHEVLFSGYGFVERDFAQSVEIRGYQICHGDYVVGERGGLVVIPPDIAEEVVRLATAVAMEDAKLIERLKQGERIEDLWAHSPRGDMAAKH